ncbi:MAG: aldo/keto reductase [Gammaproteobacteria bacterium]|nr:aldo/keto reductase [Gammaproteobacteria bacterium]
MTKRDESHQSERRQFLKRAAYTGALGVAGTSSIANAATLSDDSLVVAQRQPMPTRTLGRTGVDVPILHLGTSQSLDPTYDKVMHRCYKSGVTWFDTALSYGWGASHKAIANFIEQIGDRKSLWLTSKSGDRDVDGLVADVDKALTELNTDYLDLYLMHGVRDARMLDKEYIRAGDRLRKSGKTTFFGFSCHNGNVVELLNKAAKVGGIDAILFRYNFRRYGDRDLNLAIDACHKAGIGMLAMKTMGSVPPELETVANFQSKDFTLAQAKLKSVWADDRIASVVSEMDSVRVTKENVAAAKTQKPLTVGEAHQLNRLAAMTAQYSCEGCSHFCEQAAGGGVAIADSLRFLMYYESYGKRAHARDLYKGIPEGQRDAPQAALAAAAAVCPQGIDIAQRLAQAQSRLA